MLICQGRQIAFVQIPKNGSKSIKRALTLSFGLDHAPTAQDLGWTEQQFEAAYAAGSQDYLPAFGKNNLDHLPLSVCAQHLPATFAAFCDASSFALIRDPRRRFISALLQRMVQFGGLKDLQADDPAVRDEAEHVCQWLDGRATFVDMAYIHFARQIDYVDLEGVRIVDAIFPIGRTDLAEEWVAATTNGNFRVAQEHKRRAPKSWARPIVPLVRYLARKLVSRRLRRIAYPFWRGSRLFEDAAGRYDSLFLGERVERFIERYYAADFLLYEEACIMTRFDAPVSAKG